MDTWKTFWAYVERGRGDDIPLCCCIRFAWSCILPRFYLPGQALVRLGKLSPRYLFACGDQQGYVPCEAHLLWWVLTGERPDVRQDTYAEANTDAGQPPSLR